MGLLSGAIREERGQQESTVKSGYGSYRAYWVGMSPQFEWVSPFGDQCKLCKGSRTGINGSGDCRACKGSGKRTETRVKLFYDLENGNREEEEVQFKLSPPGTSQDGKTTFAASTLFKRLRTFSQLKNATETELDMWYSSLPNPPRIPITVNIGDNNKATALKITDVMYREPVNRSQAASVRQAPPPAPPPTSVEDDDFGDVPF